jgi:hypothetical protein
MKEDQSINQGFSDLLPGMDGNGDISQHGFGSRCGDNDFLFRIHNLNSGSIIFKKSGPVQIYYTDLSNIFLQLLLGLRGT